MNKTEILAPCGSMESLTAAVRCGADAVYLGAKNFNARRSADNFEGDTLREAVRYCHAHGVKVYITLNTLVSDGEMNAALDTAEECLAAGADAFIVQDLGLARVMHRVFPTARLHASTQCAVTTPEGFRALEELGFCRAVLPREMSLEEIREIRKSTSMELEAFVHGALCMCVSGQCYLSAMLGGRSGNRGLCAQPCRLAFSADNSGSHDLSLKDLSLLSHLPQLAEEGVISFKIEGRMKRPEYVAAAVTACRKSLEGTYRAADETVLKSVFSRSGFTDGYFTGKRRDMFGYRRKEDVLAADGVLKDLAALYQKEPQTVPLSLHFVCLSGKPLSLTATANGKSVTLTSVIPEAAQNKPFTAESLEARLSKLGGTPYFLDKLTFDLEEGLIAPASAVNALRRDAVAALGEDTPAAPERHTYTPAQPITRNSTPYFTARFTSATQIPAEHTFKRVFIPVWENDEAFRKTGAGVELPRAPFGREQQLKKRLTALRNIGVQNALCPDIGACRLAKSLGFTVYGDYALNVFNSETASLYNSTLLSFELTAQQASGIRTAEAGVLAYGKLPLMITRNCPVKNRIGCEACKKQGVLTDRKGFRFPVKCTPYPCVEILNPLPLMLSDRLHEFTADYFHFYFTDETSEQVSQVLLQYETAAPPSGKYTRGLYYRGVR